ncbi:MAG: DUF411 domain-containing protein [Betaproteobacteria bacterium]|nr:MAG: DUF411 domain-containing protein [Betaproteobacteria bacterium]
MNHHPRRRLLLALLATALVPAIAGARPGPIEVVLYKNEACGCCGKWAEHMQRSGFRVAAHNVQDLAGIRARQRVPDAFGSCHTAVVAGYAIEGHVPADAVHRLLKEKPAGVIGLAVPGMPQGSPGMESPTPQRYEVIAFDAKGAGRVYERR